MVNRVVFGLIAGSRDFRVFNWQGRRGILGRRLFRKLIKGFGFSRIELRGRLDSGSVTPKVSFASGKSGDSLDCLTAKRSRMSVMAAKSSVCSGAELIELRRSLIGRFVGIHGSKILGSES